MPDRLRYLIGGQIAASDINYEFNRSETAYFNIYDARNGNYGAINEASGYRPTANGQSGYAWSHWWGYTHSSGYPTLWLKQNEALSDMNVRLQHYNVYGAFLYDNWYFWCTPAGHTGAAGCGSDWLDWKAYAGITLRAFDSINILFNQFDGTYNPTLPYLKGVYSTARGWLYLWDYDAANIQRFTGNFQIYSNERIEVYATQR
jgi:hypothetical protein